MDEFELIDRYFSRRIADPDVLLGIGDDGAVVRPAAGRDLVTVIDSLVEGVHFESAMDPADIAYRAVAVNVSDIAAMAGRPRWMTLALTLSRADASWLEKFSEGLFEAAAEYSLTLIGGDTTRGREIVVTVQVTGDVVPDEVLRRSGARSGDGIYVTGTPGDAAAGLALMQAGASDNDASRYLYLRFARPSVRAAFASRLASVASAAIDVSDGLFGDIGKLLVASRVGGSIDVRTLPLSDELVSVHGPVASIELALAGGDDYEIAFTASPSKADALRQLAQDCSLRVTKIGDVTEGGVLRCVQGEQEYAFTSAGYRHFGANENG